MRIHPIRDLHEVLLCPPLEDCKAIACRPNWICCRPCLGACPPGCCCCHEVNPREVNINQVLLRRAMAGVLTRLRSYDWQVTHGHYVGDNGNSLDYFA